MNSKLFITFILGILLVSTASAVMINYEDGENGNPDLKVELKNNFLFIPLDEIGTAELKSHNSTTEIKKVYSTGEQVVMWYEFDFEKDYEDALGNVKFIDMRTGEEIKREYSFVYLTQEEYQEPVYSCKNITTKGNTSSVCEITNYETEIRDVWLNYNSRDISVGRQIIGIKVNVQDDDYVDCIWEIVGKEIEKHASYLLTDLIAYYKLDETSGTTAYDSLGVNNLTISGTTIGADGLILYAEDFDGSNDKTYKASFGSGVTNSNITISFWFKADVTSTTNNFLIDNRGNLGLGNGYSVLLNSNTLRFFFQDSSSSEKNVDVAFTDTTSWHHFLGFYNGTHMNFYLDGVAQTPTAMTTRATNSENTLSIGSRYSGDSGFYNGKIDEVGIWSRALTNAEVLDLYNSGSGFAYPFEEDYIFINLLSPTDEQNLTSDVITFSANLSSNGIEIENTTLNLFYDNGTLIYNNTNSSGLEGIYNWTTTLSDGNYSWNVTAFGNNSIQYNSQTYNFNIDTVSPQIEINSGNGTQTFGSLATNHTINYTITETNLDSCWLNYNGTNITIPCTSGMQNSTNFTLQYNVFNATIFANDTLGNLNSSLVVWDYKVIQNDLDYSPQGYEGQNNSIIYNMTFNGTINSILINISNVSYAVSISYDGSNYVVSSNEIIPSTTETTNYFNLIISLSGEEILTPIISQSLTMINLAVCNSTINNSFIYFNLKNEKSITEDINGSGEYAITLSTPYTNNIQTVNGSFSGINVSICSNINFSANNFTYHSGGKIKYTATGFSNENYNFIKQSIPKNITLYLLNLTYDIPFKITYFGDTNLPTSNQILELWKEYPYLNTYYLVEAPISSTTGEVLFNINSENSKYRVKVYDENYVLKKTFENQIFYCDTALVSLCEEELSGEIQSETLNDPNRTIDYEINATNESIIVDYDYLDGATKSTSVTVINKVNNVSSTIYNSTIYSSNGQFTIPLPATVKLNEQFELSLFEEDELVFSGNFIIPPKADKNGYLIAVFLLLTFVGMAMTSGTAVVLIACLGFIIAGLLLLINGIELGWNSLGYLSPLILIVGLLIWKLSNSER